MKKIIISAIASAAMLWSISAYADEFTAVCNYQAGTIEVTLKTDAPKNDTLLFYLADADADVTRITPENFAASILDVREAAGQNGVYSLSIPFPQGKGKKYQLVYENYTAVDDIGGIDLSERQIVKYIATAEETQKALSEINQASADTILEVLNQNQVILETRQFDPAKDQSVAVILIANRPAQGFSNFDELSAGIEKANAAAILKNAKAEEMTDALQKYGSVFGIVLNEDYNAATEKDGKTVYTFRDAINQVLSTEFQKLSEDSSLYQKIGEVYKEKLALTVLNNSTRDTINRVLHTYNDLFKLDLDGKYAALGSEAQLNFCKALERKNFQSVKDVQTAFSQKLSSLSNNTESGGGSSSGGGGKQSSVTYVPTTKPDQNPDQKPETKDQFNDLAGSEWAKEAIEELSKKDILSGYDDGSFRPNNTITRNEFITMLMRAFEKTDDSAEYPFTDGDAGAWYAKYIASAHKIGVLSGYEDGRFGDGENITRQDMAVMIYRLAGMDKQETETLFADDDQILDYAKDAVYTLAAKGIISGMGENRFEPQAFATRAQAARILHLILGGAGN